MKIIQVYFLWQRSKYKCLAFHTDEDQRPGKSGRGMQRYKQRVKGCDVVVGSRDTVKLFIVPLFVA